MFLVHKRVVFSVVVAKFAVFSFLVLFFLNFLSFRCLVYCIPALLLPIFASLILIAILTCLFLSLCVPLHKITGAARAMLLTVPIANILRW